MELISHILLILFVILIINSMVKYPLDKLTMYRKSDISSQATWFIILFMFFGVFMLLFYRPIRQYRKEYYIKNKIRTYEFWMLQHNMYMPRELNYGQVWPDYGQDSVQWHEEYINNIRYIKLKKLQKKSKKCNK